MGFKARELVHRKVGRRERKKNGAGAGGKGRKMEPASMSTGMTP